MTKPQRNSVLAGIAGCALLALAAVAVQVTGRGDRSPAIARTADKPTKGQGGGDTPDLAPRQIQGIPSGSPLADVPIPPLPADAPSVPDEYLLKLSGLVGLANARYVRPDKSRWEMALPIAQKLLQAPCDCEQRNWLNHFVEMGGYALSDSAHQYHDQAELIATLGRNDTDAMSRSQRPD